jgi:hypothetical protein
MLTGAGSYELSLASTDDAEGKAGFGNVRDAPLPMAQKKGFLAERSSFKAADLNPHVARMGTGSGSAETPRVGGDRSIDQIVGLKIAERYT